MQKINFAARHDYEFLANYKVLQNVFIRNRIDKPIPIDRLVRCKMQDNLEFLQWLKKFWDMNYAGDGVYDAERRRGAQSVCSGSSTPSRRPGTGAGTRPRASVAPRASVGARTGSRPSTAGSRPSTAGPRPSSARVAPSGTGHISANASPTRRMSTMPGRGLVRGPSAAAISNETINQLTAEIDEMKISVDSLERERDFYFGKLRDIELLLQERLGDLLRPAEGGAEAEEVPVDPGLAPEIDTLKQIQGVLYQTEEGFELPNAVNDVCTFM